MNRKLLPLLGIAFGVAVISTGIFYGLVVGKLRSAPKRAEQPILVAVRSLDRGMVLEKTNVKLASPVSPSPGGSFTDPDQVAGLTVLKPIAENEPITQENASARNSGAGVAQAIPPGMRAVSIRVPDSPGVINLLRPGHKVDVQVIRSRNNAQNGAETELRTVLEDVEVLAIQSDAAPGRPATTAVLTVLAKPTESDMLSLADAAARIRLALRNPGDHQKASPASMVLAALFESTGRATQPLLRAAASKDPAPPPGPQVQLRVRIAEAAPAALEEFNSRLLSPRRTEGFDVRAFRPGWDVESAVESFQTRRLFEILSASNLMAVNNRQVSMQAGSRSGAGRSGVRIQFLPWLSSAGKLRLRVEPEITSAEEAGVTTRKFQTEINLADGQSVLVTGLSDPRPGVSLTSRLFPGHGGKGTGGELVVLATPQLLPPAAPERRTAAAVRGN